MTAEFGPKPCRIDESRLRPYGGNVSKEPLPQALYGLALSRGFESQRALAKALGKKTNTTVGKWYMGINAPSPQEFGSLLVLFAPNDEELEALVGAWGQELQAGRGINPGQTAGSEAARRRGLKLMKRSGTPIGRWIEGFCRRRRLTIEDFDRTVGITARGRSRRHLGLASLSRLLEVGPQAFELTGEQIEELSRAVAQTMDQEIKRGHRFQSSPRGLALKKIQGSVDCKTYNGEEAARELEVSREAVRQHRNKLGLPLLVTFEQLELIRADLKKSSAF